DHYVGVDYISSDTTRPALAVWDPWAWDTGWYWEAYNAQAPGSANVLGIFAGPASQAIGAAASGVGLYNGPAGDRTVAAGLTLAMNRTTADARVLPRNRFAWGLFLGTKGEDLLPPDQVQPIGQQMNVHAGINLDKVQHYDPNFVDPLNGYGALYMDRATVDRLIQRVRQDPSYYQYLYDAEPTIRPILDLWRDPTRVHQVVQDITGLAQGLLNALVNGDGIYD